MTVKRYATKPSYVYAIQYTGENIKDVISFAGRNVVTAPGDDNNYTQPVKKVITPIGLQTLNVGDYVVKYADGEFDGQYDRHSLNEFHTLYNGVW